MATRIPSANRGLNRRQRKVKSQKQKVKTKSFSLLSFASSLLRVLRSPDKSTETAALNELQNPRIRFLMVWVILMAGGLMLVLNLYRLQVVRAGELQKQARQQQQVPLRPFIPRRPIVDRNGNVLALDQPVYTLYAHPKLFKKSKEAIAAQLAPLLGAKIGDLFEKLNSSETGVTVAYAVPEQVANRVSQEYLDGLELLRHQQRFYPQKELAADLVGYVDAESKGQAGLEYSQQELLKRSEPISSDQSNSEGCDRTDPSVKSSSKCDKQTRYLIPDPVPKEFLRFDDLRLQLTLDSRLQRAARAALKKQLQQTGAKRGTVMVMDAKDGSLLSLVSEPSYDPNQYYKFDLGLFKNWAISDLYEPGSTFKPIAVAIALEAGAIKRDSVFNDEGRIYVDRWPIQNADFEYAGGRGPLSVTEILQYSSNIGMVHVVEQMRSRIFYSWLERLGLGKPVGIDLPFETASNLRSRSEFTASPVHPATTAFGQGFSLTPLQLLQLHGILANGGKLVTPHVVQGLFNSQGTLQWQPQLPPPQQVFSPKTTQTVVSMLEEVVQEGTGKNAQIPGYRIAGKTGTSQKASDGGGYSDSAIITSFVGILPADSPRYVVLAVVDEPHGGSGGVVAAPIVKSVMEALIKIEGLPPSQN